MRASRITRPAPPLPPRLTTHTALPRAQPQDQGREIAKKYMKRVEDTVSDKVARADKRAKKRAKFSGGEDAEGEDAASEEEDADDDESVNDEDMTDVEEEEDEEPAPKRGRAPHAAAGGAAGGRAQPKPTHRATSREELQELLAKKMKQFAGSRPKVEGQEGEKASEVRKRKREERQEMKKKLKAKEKQKQTSVPIPSPMPKDSHKGHTEQNVDNNDENFSFGRIKMAGVDVVGGGRDKNKKYREQPEKLLKKIAAKNKKIEELGGEDTEEGKKFIQRQRWGASIDRAQVKHSQKYSL